MSQSSDTHSSVTTSPLLFSPWLSLSPGLGSPYPWLHELKSEERGLCLIRLLLTCVEYVAAGNIENANISLAQISHLASPDGDTVQRMAAYFTQALADRMVKGLPGLHRALNSTRMFSIADEILVQRAFFEICPFLKVAYVITNQAIIEAMEREMVIHIIDLNPIDAAQWLNLFQLLSARPEGPPSLLITGVHEHREILEHMAPKLNDEAEKLKIPFRFHPVVSTLEKLDLESLQVTNGEALAVCSLLQLHTLLASDDEMVLRNSPFSRNNPNPNHLQRVIQINRSRTTLGEWLKKDSSQFVHCPSPDLALSPQTLAPSQKIGRFLNSLWNLSPKLVIIAEQESNHNDITLIDRVKKSLNFYGALFDSLDSTVPRTSIERQQVEKMRFGEEIKNIIAREGAERKERHEKLTKWILRLESSGFGRVPLSYYTMLQANILLQNKAYEGYNIKDENGCHVICWRNTHLFTVSAWRAKRHDGIDYQRI